MRLGERGDTLIEVSFALVILGAVLAGSSTVAVKALGMAQTARERTTISEVAQEQLEQLRSFRDDNSWDVFLNGQSSPSFPGVLLTSASGCHKSAVCYHMELKTFGASQEYVPVSGPTGGTVPTSWLEIQTLPQSQSPTGTRDFIVSYDFETLGGGPDSEGHVRYRLANLYSLQNIPGGPPPPPPPPSYTDCTDLANARLPYYYYFIGVPGIDTNPPGTPPAFHVWWYHNPTAPEHHIDATTFPTGAAIPPGTYTYYIFAKDNRANPGAANRSLHYRFLTAAGSFVDQTGDTNPLPGTSPTGTYPEFSPVATGIVNFASPVKQIQAEHATKDPTQPDVERDGGTPASPDDGADLFDDSLDGACLALTP